VKKFKLFLNMVIEKTK